MERIIIAIDGLTERDQEYILRIANQENTMRVEHSNNTIVLYTSFIDVMQRVTHRLITCAIGFRYEPHIENA